MRGARPPGPRLRVGVRGDRAPSPPCSTGTATDAGQLVEVSAQEAGLAGTTPWSLCLEDYARINPYLPTAGNRNADGAYWVLPAADGWVRTVIGSPRQWDGFVKLLREPGGR